MGATGITGTLKYVADYSSAYGSGEDSGNYLVVKATVPGMTGATIKAELINGTHGEVTLDDDGILITRITDKATQKLKFTASCEGLDSVSVTYDLTGLTLNQF